MWFIVRPALATVILLALLPRPSTAQESVFFVGVIGGSVQLSGDPTTVATPTGFLTNPTGATILRYVRTLAHPAVNLARIGCGRDLHDVVHRHTPGANILLALLRPSIATSPSSVVGVIGGSVQLSGDPTTVATPTGFATSGYNQSWLVNAFVGRHIREYVTLQEQRSRREGPRPKACSSHNRTRRAITR